MLRKAQQGRYEPPAVPAHYVVVREAELCTYTTNQTEYTTTTMV